MRIVATFVSLVLAGCATAAAERALEEHERQAAAVRVAEREADEEHQKAALQWCRDHPGECRLRRLLEIFPDGTSRWIETTIAAPPQSMFTNLYEAAVRRRVVALQGRMHPDDEVAIGIRKMLDEQWESGEWTDDQYKALVDDLHRRMREAIRQDRKYFEARVEQAKAQDLATVTALLNAVAVGLNAYAATLGPRPVRASPPAAWSAPPAPPLRPRATIASCTYGLLALGGRQLCALSDGSVISQMPPGEPTYRDLHPGTGR